MAWIDHVKDFFEHNKNHKDPFDAELTKYLMEESGLGYDKVTCDRTVFDVLNMDEDLLDFVKAFVQTGNVEGEDLSCDAYFTMEEFLEQTGYNPITAALMFQHYRNDPIAALRGLMMHDVIETSELPPMES